MKLLLFVTIIKLVLAQEPSPCDEYIIEQFILPILSNSTPNVPLPTVLYSGKGLNDLGSYIICQNNPEYRYFRLLLKPYGTFRHFSMGICWNAVCQQEDLEKYEQITAEVISQITPKFPIETALYQDPDIVYPKKNFLYYLVLIMVWIIILLNVFGVILSCVYQEKEKQKQVLEQSKIQVSEVDQIDISTQLRNDNKEDISPTSPSVLEQQAVAVQTYSYMNDQSSLEKSAMSDSALLQQQTQKKKPQPFWIKLVKCFAFNDNYNKLFLIRDAKPGETRFDIFNGIRALSIFWVIYGHDYLIRLGIPANIADVPSFIKHGGLNTLGGAAYFAVDVFFFMGGFLAAVTVLDKLAKLKVLHLNIIPQMWIHRFLRIWPVYIFTLLVYYKLSVFWFSGPIWGEYVTQANYCDNTFWRNLLFIDPFFKHNQQGLEYCFGWGWYLANDFWIFFITPPLFLFYTKYPKAGLILLISIFIGSLSLAYGIVWSYNYHANIPTADPHVRPEPDYQDTFYYMPWIRISPYIMGILYGLLYREWKNKSSKLVQHWVKQIQTSVLIRTIMYIVGISLTTFITFIVIPLQSDMSAWGNQAQYLYQVFNRVLFVLGLILCITPSILGVKNDPCYIMYYIIKYNFPRLGSKIWVPIARISFCMYLVQYAVIEFTTYGSTMINYLQNNHILFFILTDSFYTILVGGLLSLMVEVPLTNIEKLMFTSKRGRKSEEL